MLTVCHVTSVHVAVDSRILYHECRSLAKRWRTVLVCRDDSGARELEGVLISPLPRAKSRLARFAGTRQIVAAAEATNAAVYHFHDPELLPAMARLARRTGAPVIYDAHEHYPDAMDQKAWIPTPLRPIVSRWADRLERRHVPAMAAVVTADDALTRRFSAMHSRVVQLDNYPPLALFGVPTAPPERPATLLYVGGLSTVRGFFDMIEALRLVRRHIPDARLLLYGRPTEEVSARLSQVEKLFPAGVLDLRGPLPYGQLPSALAEAHVGLSLLQRHPKYEKNVSMKVFDYMAAGVPYVASDFPPLRAAVGDIGGTLVEPSNPSAAAEAIIALLVDPGAAAHAAKAGRALVESKLNWDSMEPRLFGLYDELLG